jgi:hypothetical protein
VNPDTQGTINKISFFKNIIITTTFSTNNLSNKKLNRTNTTTKMIFQHTTTNTQIIITRQTTKSDHVESHDTIIQRK